MVYKYTTADAGLLAALQTLVEKLADRQLADRIAAAMRGDDMSKVEEPIAQKVVSGEEAGKILGLDRRSVTLLAKQGHIQRVVLPGRVRSCGFLRASVEALLAAKGGDK